MGRIILAVYLIVLCIFDCRECKIPVCGVVLGMVLSGLWVLGECFACPDRVQWTLLNALLGCIPGVIMLLVGWLSKKVGCGDGMILVSVGMVIGYRSCFVLLCASLLLMSLFCIGLLILKKGNRNTRIAYLPFLGVVYLVGMFVGKGG